jgi:HK97 family phage major capsid protein
MMKVEDDTEIKELVEKQSKAFKGIEEKLDELDKEVKKAGPGVAALKAEIETRLKDFGKLADDGREAMKKEMQKRIDELEVKFNAAGLASGVGEKPESAGQLVIENDEIKALTGKSIQSVRPMSISVKSFRKEVLGTPGSAGDLVIPFRVPGIIQPVPNQQLRLRDILTVTPISTPVLQYVRSLMFGSESGSSGQLNGNANVVAEGDPKPRADMRFKEEQAVASTIATWLPASKQILADAPVLRGFIDTQLLYSLLLEEELQVLYGSGIAPNLEGITLLAQVYNPQPGDTGIDGLRRMIAQVLAARFPATGFVANPLDWVEVELEKDKVGRYIIGDPNTMLGSRIWGLPVVQSESIIQGNALCGAFGMGATLYDREEANVQIAEQHEDFFTRNMIAIRAEERIMLPIFRPAAFVYGVPSSPSAS